MAKYNMILLKDERDVMYIQNPYCLECLKVKLPVIHIYHAEELSNFDIKNIRQYIKVIKLQCECNK